MAAATRRNYQLKISIGHHSRLDFTQIVESDYEIGTIIFRNLAKIISERLKKANKDILKLTTAFVLAVEK